MEAQVLDGAPESALAQKQRRRDALALQVEDATREAQAQQRALVDGTGDAAAAGQARGQAQALGGALATLDGELAADRAAIEATRAAQERQARLQAAVDAANVASYHGRDFLAALAEMDAALQAGTAKALGALKRTNEGQAAYMAAVAELAGMDVFTFRLADGLADQQQKFAALAQVRAAGGDAEASNAALSFAGGRGPQTGGLAFASEIRDALAGAQVQR